MYLYKRGIDVLTLLMSHDARRMSVGEGKRTEQITEKACVYFTLEQTCDLIKSP